MEASGMTQAALLDALREAMERGPDDDSSALTTQELMEAMGLTMGRVRALLKSLLAAGQCEPARVRRADMTGRVQTVPGYRMKGHGMKAA